MNIPPFGLCLGRCSKLIQNTKLNEPSYKGNRPSNDMSRYDLGHGWKHNEDIVNNRRKGIYLEVVWYYLEKLCRKCWMIFLARNFTHPQNLSIFSSWNGRPRRYVLENHIIIYEKSPFVTHDNMAQSVDNNQNTKYCHHCLQNHFYYYYICFIVPSGYWPFWIQINCGKIFQNLF